MSEGNSSAGTAHESVRPISGSPGTSVLAALPAAVAAIAATAISLRWGSHLADTDLRACASDLLWRSWRCSRPACWRCRSGVTPGARMCFC